MLVAHREACHAARRTKDEARVHAQGLLVRARAGEDLGALAADFSDEPYGQRRRGALTVPVTFEGPFGPVDDLAVGQADLRESDYGFHVIARVA